MLSRKPLAIGALAAGLLLGGLGSAAVAEAGNTPDAAGFGQHVSMMAREHGGMANATAHHNEMYNTDLTVGEHQAMMREMGCALPTE